MKLTKEIQLIKTAAINFPLKDIKGIIEKWEWIVKGGVDDVELLALYFFYSDLAKKVHILCPEYSLPYRDLTRRVESITLTIWARFPSSMPELLD